MHQRSFNNQFKPRQGKKRNINMSLTAEKFTTVINNFIEKNKDFTVLDTVFKKFLMDLLIPMNIKFNLEKHDTYYTLTLTTDRNGGNFNIPLVRQSNGAVWKITEDLQVKLLVVPSYEFNNSFSALDIEQYLKDNVYNVYPLEDGTSINIYWDNEWKYATKNSHDCFQIEWRGFKFGNLINECLSKYPKFNLNELLKDCVYSIGFHHPAHHPFDNKEPRVWLIQIYNKTTNNTVIMDIGIPLQQTIDLQQYNAVANPRLDKSIFNNLTLTCNTALQNYLNGEAPIMGFILRSKDQNLTKAYSDILIESNLFQNIKKCIYDIPYIKNKSARLSVKSKFKNFDYVIVNAWLDFTKNSIFFKLFPQYAHYQERFDKVLEKSVDKIADALANPSTLLETHIQVFRESTDDEAANNIAAMLAPVVKEKISDYDKMIIRNLILRPEYTDIYCEALF